MKKLVLAIALLLIIPVMLVGCSSESDESAIKSSINGFVSAYNSKNYDKCTDYLLGITDATKDATKTMLTLAREASGEVEVTNIEVTNVDGDSATAKVTVKLMGETQTNTATLTKSDGKWKFGFDLFSGE